MIFNQEKDENLSFLFKYLLVIFHLKLFSYFFKILFKHWFYGCFWIIRSYTYISHTAYFCYFINFRSLSRLELRVSMRRSVWLLPNFPLLFLSLPPHLVIPSHTHTPLLLLQQTQVRNAQVSLLTGMFCASALLLANKPRKAFLLSPSLSAKRKVVWTRRNASSFLALRGKAGPKNFPSFPSLPFLLFQGFKEGCADSCMAEADSEAATAIWERMQKLKMRIGCAESVGMRALIRNRCQRNFVSKLLLYPPPPRTRPSPAHEIGRSHLGKRGVQIFKIFSLLYSAQSGEGNNVSLGLASQMKKSRAPLFGTEKSNPNPCWQ